MTVESWPLAGICQPCSARGLVVVGGWSRDGVPLCDQCAGEVTVHCSRSGQIGGEVEQCGGRVSPSTGLCGECGSLDEDWEYENTPRSLTERSGRSPWVLQVSLCECGRPLREIEQRSYSSEAYFVHLYCEWCNRWDVDTMGGV